MNATQTIPYGTNVNVKTGWREPEGLSFAPGQYRFVRFDTPKFVWVRNSSGYTTFVPSSSVEFPEIHAHGKRFAWLLKPLKKFVPFPFLRAS